MPDHHAAGGGDRNAKRCRRERWHDAQHTADPEAAQIDAAVALSFAQQQMRDDETADREEQFDPDDAHFAEGPHGTWGTGRSEEHTSELQSLMRISYAVFCLKKKKK